MLLASTYLGRYPSRFAAYNALQCALMRHYIARGGSPSLWCERMAPKFRARYGWMLG